MVKSTPVDLNDGTEKLIKASPKEAKKKKPNKKNPAINDSNQQFSHQQDTWTLYSLSTEQKRPTAKEKEVLNDS